ncbi:hypothetical protein T11_4716 [Trichinella zimbabwensis]|uniref:Uncharacterized protein n=1 Tax=Trichinella zimbabwensis TaxID=268475 RepID=A0A0V1HJM2_9BILA|nr:hypothetical protein T11_4716 [Trichinella zimbabwensis]
MKCSAGTTGNLLALFQYFRQEWMQAMRDCRFGIINNHLEGWHNRFSKKAGKSHVRFYELLHLLIAEQGVVKTFINQLLSRVSVASCLRQVTRTYADVYIRVNTPAAGGHWSSIWKL